MRKNKKSLFDIILISCSIICTFIIGFYVYYHYFVKEQTVGINNVSQQLGLDIVSAEDLTEEEIDEYEERWFINANYYSNDKNNGLELQELNFKYFRTYELQSADYRETGMQYVGNYQHTNVNVSSESELNNYVFKDFYYYDTTDGISYTGTCGSNASVSTNLKRNSSFTIRIDEKPYEIKLDKHYHIGWWIFGYEHYYTYGEFFESVFKSIQTNSAGYGDYYITLNLSDYFTIYEYKDGKIVYDDVVDIVKNYAVCKVHYDENGAVNANQSLFGYIECNKNYGITEVDTTYWQATNIYNLTNTSLQLRYSEAYNGYIASLSMDNKKTLNNSITNITIDLDTTKNIVGIDYNGFENVKIDTLTLTSSKSENITFYLLDSSLKNTEIETLRTTNNVTLNISETAINNEYTGVTI